MTVLATAAAMAVGTQALASPALPAAATGSGGGAVPVADSGGSGFMGLIQRTVTSIAGGWPLPPGVLDAGASKILTRRSRTSSLEAKTIVDWASSGGTNPA